MAATGSCHQYGVERPGPGGLAWAHYGLEALDQADCQLVGLAEFSLVVGHGAAAALAGRNHHLDAVGAQHLHGGLVHGWIK